MFLGGPGLPPIFQYHDLTLFSFQICVPACWVEAAGLAGPYTSFAFCTYRSYSYIQNRGNQIDVWGRRAGPVRDIPIYDWLVEGENPP